MTSVDRKEHVLVTGGAGYVGSHTCKILSQQGYTPVTFDNLSGGYSHAVKWGPLIKGDLNDLDSIIAACHEYNFNTVIHFASYIEVAESVESPGKYYRNNIGGTLNLLDAMQGNNIKNLVFSSSCALYGIPDKVPITEDTVGSPLSPYGWSKLVIEKIIQDFSLAYNMRYVLCRYFNACGADSEAEIGEEHQPETHLIPRALMAVAGDAPSFKIYGTDYDTTDGTCIRDYIHVQDLARAHILALKHLEKDGKNCALNLGTGTGYSVREILEAVKEITNCDMVIQEGDRRMGDPSTLIADIKKAHHILGFQTEMSDLETIIKTAWNFYQKQGISSE